MADGGTHAVKGITSIYTHTRVPCHLLSNDINRNYCGCFGDPVVLLCTYCNYSRQDT